MSAARAILIAGAILVSVVSLALQAPSAAYNADEGLWIEQGQVLWPLFRQGAWERDEWTDIDLSWGFPNPPIGKYLIGAFLEARGIDEKIDPDVDVPLDVLTTARMPSVVLGIVAVVALYFMGARLLNRHASLWAVLLLATSPIFMTASLHAMVDIHGLAFSVAAMAFVLAAGVFPSSGSPGRERIGAIAAAGAAAGLAMASKLTAIGTGIAVGASFAILAIRDLAFGRGAEGRRWVRTIALAALFGSIALGVFVVVNPYLYPDALSRFRAIVNFWETLWQQRAANPMSFYDDAFLPVREGLAWFVRILIAPWSAIGLGALILSVGWAWSLRRSAPRNRLRLRLATWALMAMLAVAIGCVENQIVLPWFLWVGTAAGLVLAGSCPRHELGKSVNLAHAILVAGWAMIIAAFVWNSTYVPWGRYYLPMLPFACLIAGWSFESLHADVSTAAGRTPARFLDASILLGALAAPLSSPDHAVMKLSAFRSPAFSYPGVIVLWIAILGFVLSVAWALVRAERLSTDSPLPEPARSA